MGVEQHETSVFDTVIMCDDFELGEDIVDKRVLGAREMTRQLGLLSLLPEDLSLAPHVWYIYMSTHT